MEFKDAIIEVLVYEGRFSPEYSDKLANDILEESTRLGQEVPSFNLLWSIISRETTSKREFAEYILELYYRGGYINKTEQEIDRILDMMKPKK